jgi:hypothetical protein
MLRRLCKSASVIISALCLPLSAGDAFPIRSPRAASKAMVDLAQNTRSHRRSAHWVQTVEMTHET